MCRYSIIVPVYNAERTLKRCLDSLLTQPHDMAEIIVVNDGSQDCSDAICREYAEKDERIVYLCQENAGVSAARNRGIAVARGEYILFVDSDDYVASDYFAQLDVILEEHNADLTVFSEYHCKAGMTSEISRGNFFTCRKEILYPKVSELICKKVISGPVTKIYKRDLIEQFCITFPVGVSIGEDRAFNIKYAMHIASVQTVNIPLYYVSLDNEVSLSRSKTRKLELQTGVAEREIHKELEGCELTEDEKRYFREALNFGACRVVYTYAKTYWQNSEKLVERHRKIRQMCKEINSHKYTYPHTLYCSLITIPVRLRLVWLIDLMAWKLTH